MRIHFGEMLLAAGILAAGSARADTVYAATYQPPGVDIVSPTGIVTPFCSGISEFNSMIADGHGNLYVSSYANVIYKINAQGTASVFATTGLANPQGMAFDAAGNLYVANENNQTIEEFNAQGQPTLFANTGTIAPEALAFDSNGNLYAALGGSSTIEKYNAAGVGTPFATVNSPYCLAYYNGSLYAGSSLGSGAIVDISLNGGGTSFITTGVDGPQELAFDSNGNLYCANDYNNTITEYGPQGTYSLFGSDAYLNGIAVGPVPEPSAGWIGALGGILLTVARRCKAGARARNLMVTKPRD